MKKTLLFLIPVLIFFSSCRKDFVEGPAPIIDESQWLNQERALVIASDISCQYYVVETYNGYAVLKTWDGYIPFEGSVMYGDFSSWGVKTFYNRSERQLVRSDVREYWLGYYDALDEMEYQCDF